MGLCNLLISQWLNFPGSESQSPLSDARADPARRQRLLGSVGGQGEPRALPVLLPPPRCVTLPKFLVSAPSHPEQLFLLREEKPHGLLCPALPSLPAVRNESCSISTSFSRSCTRGFSTQKGFLSSAGCQFLVLTSLPRRTFGKNH